MLIKTYIHWRINDMLIETLKKILKSNDSLFDDFCSGLPISDDSISAIFISRLSPIHAMSYDVIHHKQSLTCQRLRSVSSSSEVGQINFFCI